MVLDKAPHNVEYLKKHETIGCRDTDTYDRATALGLDAYFCGCPSILCDPHPSEVEEPGTITFVDVNPRLFTRRCGDFSRKTLEDKLIEHMEIAPITWYSQVVCTDLSEEERWALCEYRHRMLTRSEMIVTSKIHVALPALGMGKAVVFVKDEISVPGRLTAFPPSFKTYEPEQCPRIVLRPEEHRYDVSAYRAHVAECTDRAVQKIVG